MKRFTLLVLFLWTGAAFSQSLNMNLPNTPQSYQQDRIRAGDLECSMAIGSSTHVEFGVVGLMNEDDPTYNLANGDPYNNYNYDNFMRDVGVYGKIVIPIGAPKERLNCNTLYQLELRKKRLEVEKLEAEIANLRRMQFEDN
jgi:hypothetical protein